jgi:iron complex transport system permease protein
MEHPLRHKQSRQTRDFRSLQVLLGGLVLLIAAVLLALCQGAVPLSSSELYQALLRQGDMARQTIIWDLRIPRIIIGLLVGGALGMSGAMLQAMLRNSLADAFVLGISSGAGLVAILLLTVLKLSSWVPLGAWGGALVAAALVYILGYRRGGMATEQLVLAGVAISSLFGAIQTVMILFAEESRVSTALNWLIGSLNGRGWQDIWLVLPYLAVALGVGSGLGKTLNLLNLGAEMALSLGVDLLRSRILIGATASLLAASAVSLSGLVGFVGLVVPHGVRLLVGNDYRWVLPLSGLMGALVLTLADLLCRLGPVELPVGAVTALFGSPLFLWLLYRQRQGGLL